MPKIPVLEEYDEYDSYDEKPSVEKLPRKIKDNPLDLGKGKKPKRSWRKIRRDIERERAHNGLA